MSARSDRPRPLLSWSLTVECPFCERELDESEIDQDGEIARKIFSNQWDKIEGEKIECPGCCHEFELGEVEY